MISLDSLFNIPDNPGTLSISTFNIQLLGHFKKKDNEALADLLKDIDIVEIWELVEPLYNSINPDGKKYVSDDD